MFVELYLNNKYANIIFKLMMDELKMSSKSNKKENQEFSLILKIKIAKRFIDALSVFNEYFDIIVRRHLEYREKREEVIEECIKKIKNDPILINFMNELVNDPILLRIFTTQIKILTSTQSGETTYLCLFLTDDNSKALPILKRHASEKLSELEKRYLGIKPWISKISQDYLGIDIANPDEAEPEKVENADDFLKRVDKILKDAKKKEFKKEVIDIFEEFLHDPTKLINEIGVIGQAHFVEKGINHKEYLSKIWDFNSKKYSENLKQLIDMKILRYWITISWCSSHPNTPYSLFMFGHNDIPQIKCPTCKKKLHSGAILTFHPEVADFLMNKNGFLSILLGWILEKNNIKWKSCVYNNGRETDILCGPFKGKKYVVIEVKTFSTDNMNLRIISSNISRKSNQIIRNIKSWKKRDKTISGGIFYCNYFGKDFLNAKNNIYGKKSELEQHNISIMGLDDLSNFISNIKGKVD
jgi:hypothetical protein